MGFTQRYSPKFRLTSKRDTDNMCSHLLGNYFISYSTGVTVSSAGTDEAVFYLVLSSAQGRHEE
jgi:hypothetical protein